jgi:hypothetical protein
MLRDLYFNRVKYLDLLNLLMSINYKQVIILPQRLFVKDLPS